MNALKFNPTVVLIVVAVVILAGIGAFVGLEIAGHGDSTGPLIAFITPTIVALLALVRGEGVAQTINGTKEKTDENSARLDALEQKV